MYFQIVDSGPASVPVSSLPPHPTPVHPQLHPAVPTAAPHHAVDHAASHVVAPLQEVNQASHVTATVAPATHYFSHLPFSLPLVKPPEHHDEPVPRKPDPYLASENELRGKSFDDPFWYPKHRHIIKGYKNKERGDKVDHRDI